VIDFQFPRSTVLVLGNENAGIRVEIIQLLDGCVEIRQHAWDNPCLVPRRFSWEYKSVENNGSAGLSENAIESEARPRVRITDEGLWKSQGQSYGQSALLTYTSVVLNVLIWEYSRQHLMISEP
jgi:hypothetical protein